MFLLIPQPHFAGSAETFDNGMLLRMLYIGEEAYLQLANQLGGNREGVTAHMWGGYRYSLLMYVNQLKKVARKRGFKTTEYEFPPLRMIPHVHLPPWFGDERVHISHQAILLRGNRRFYERYGWGVMPDYPVLAPVSWVYTMQRSRRTVELDFEKVFNI